MTMPARFDASRCVVFDLECYPGRWCVGFHGIDQAGRLSTKIVETKNDLEGLLMRRRGVRLCFWFPIEHVRTKNKV